MTKSRAERKSSFVTTVRPGYGQPILLSTTLTSMLTRQEFQGREITSISDFVTPKIWFFQNIVGTVALSSKWTFKALGELMNG